MKTPAPSPLPKSWPNPLTIAHSPDPDDAYMFFGFTQKGVLPPGLKVRHVLKDIQTLNRAARRGTYHLTAISAAALPQVAHRYRVLSVGASVGRGYGPRVVARADRLKALALEDWSSLKVAVPGLDTTARLVLKLYRRHYREMVRPFDQILAAVEGGEADAGLVIHEGQLTHARQGVRLVVDLGRWWGERTGLPLPLGLDVVRKDLGPRRAQALAQLLHDSILYADRHPREAMDYALKWGRGVSKKVGRRFVKMYVNADTLDLGRDGEKALRRLFIEAKKAGLIPRIPRWSMVK